MDNRERESGGGVLQGPLATRPEKGGNTYTVQEEEDVVEMMLIISIWLHRNGTAVALLFCKCVSIGMCTIFMENEA